MNDRIRLISLMSLLLICTAIAFAEDPVSTEKFEGQDAVILLEKGIIDHMFTTELSKKTYEYKIKYLTQKGIQDHGSRTVYFSPSKENLSGIKGSVILPDGSEIKISKKDIFEKDVIKDNGRKVREVNIVFPSLQPGAVVEYTYDLSFNGISQTSYWSFQDELFTVQSEVTFIAWPEYRHGYSIRNLIQEPEIKDTKPGGHKALNVSRYNIPALPRENYSLPYESQTESITFYYLASKVKQNDYWGEWSDHYYKRVLADMMEPCKQAREIIRTEFPKRARDEELIYDLYNYVTSHYFALDMLSKKEKEEVDKKYRDKLNRIKKSSQLFEYKYLNQLQINYLLASMIKTAFSKIQVDLVFYIPWDEDLFDPYLKTLWQFSDSMVVVTLNNKTIYLSPAKRFMKPNMTEWAAKGIKVFMVGENASKIRKLPLDKYSANCSTTREDIGFDLENGTVNIKRTQEYDQYKSYSMRSALFFFNDQERKDFLENVFKKLYGDEFKLNSYTISNLEDFTQPLIIETDFSYPFEFELAGDQIFFRFPGFDRIKKNPFQAETRYSNIAYQYPYQNTQEIVYHLPPELSFQNFPSELRINEGFFKYYKEFEKIDDHTFSLKCTEILVGNILKKEASKILTRVNDDILKAGDAVMILSGELP